ncbi:hypothetical protein BDV25DRAFT_135177 [Aspergillus avenaceus]|uniref:Kelch repeat protein n=1 Tax=Aspergillus avenaceus TaxID=36643 RepID=A0A5N6U935_ASPAV|nr:hypothetical protein BDV25DRAFT_135177 [Aspergillus avenaceus]
MADPFTILTVLGMLAPLGLAQRNCTRMFHSAVINNDTLYIDGGDMHTVLPNDTLVSNSIRDLQSLDLSRSWKNLDDGLFTYIPRPWNTSHPGSYPPYMDEGGSWSDGNYLFFYGGYPSPWGGPPPPPLGTWMYNIAGNNWTRNRFWGVPMVRLHEGGAVQSSVDKTAYYLSSALNPRGNPTFAGTPGADTYLAPALIMLNMNTLEWRNASTASMNAWGTIGDGYFSIIESVVEKGVLVAFGGYTYPVGQKLSVLAARQANTTHQNSMEYVRVYDIANDQWYTQQTSGDIPRWRMSGCTVVAAAPDLSSHSIYMFGGIGPTMGVSDGNVYVLSVPSFRWIRVFDDNTVRSKHKCQLARKHTMIVIGGIVPVDNDEYVPRLQNCDGAMFANGVGIFDLRTLSWMTNYNASDDGDYYIHSKISKVIGGNGTGGATLTEPSSKFHHTDLATLFSRRNARPTSSAGMFSSTSSTAAATTTATNSPKSTISGGAIAGATIGAVAGAGLLLALVFLYLRRLKAKARLSRHRGRPYRHPKVFQEHPSELAGAHTPMAFELADGRDTPNAGLPTEAIRCRSF